MTEHRREDQSASRERQILERQRAADDIGNEVVKRWVAHPNRDAYVQTHIVAAARAAYEAGFQLGVIDALGAPVDEGALADWERELLEREYAERSEPSAPVNEPTSAPGERANEPASAPGERANEPASAPGERANEPASAPNEPAGSTSAPLSAPPNEPADRASAPTSERAGAERNEP